MISYKEIKQTKNINTGCNDLDFGITPKEEQGEQLSCLYRKRSPIARNNSR